MILTIDSPAFALAPFGDKLRLPLERLGIRTIRDLLLYYPLRHEDYRARTSIASLGIGVRGVVAGRITAIGNRRSWQKHMVVTEGIVEDDSGSLRMMWFRQPYIAHQLHVGDEVVLSGMLKENRYGAAMIAPTFEKVGKNELIHTSGFVAQYPLTKGLSQRQLRYLLYKAFPFAEELNDWIPPALRGQYHLLGATVATRTIHAPKDSELLEQAKWRLGFEEIFRFQCQAQLVRSQRAVQHAPVVAYDHEWFSSIVKQLPLRLTTDQRTALWAIFQDLKRGTPMNRLLIGDVGTGKTVVAALAMAAVAHQGGQAILLAPTELLCLQHYRTVCRLVGSFVPAITIYTRSFQERFQNNHSESLTVAAAKKWIARGQSGIIVGTHALLSQSVSIPQCVLVVVDEQHRFGVQQRKVILAKGDGHTLHHLSMTATPIPRTFALTFFGDLDCSRITQFPTGKRIVTTEVVDEEDAPTIVARIMATVARKEGIYVVCPRIRESDMSGKASVERVLRQFKSQFSTVRWGSLHGRMSSAQQQEAMEDFRSGRIDGLVSTTVVEVGVDVGHATLLIVENAEQFGLSQLHQLRGRVGRKGQPAQCVLVVGMEAGEEANQRLQVLVETQDGDVVAQKDLEFRGPGVFLGVAQSGEAKFRFATLSNHEMVKAAHTAAKELLGQDPTLEHFPLVREQLFERG